MNNFKFENSTKIFFGKNCVKEYFSCILRNYGKNIVLIYEEDNLPVVEEIMPILEADNKEILKVLISPRLPELEKIMECVHSISDKSYDLILGIGSDSTIQFCKAVSLMSCKKDKIWKRYMENQGIIDFNIIPVGIISTSINLSSVMNGHIEIIHKEEGYIGSREYQKCSPVFAFLDPENAKCYTKSRIIQDGFMIFVSLLESYFSDEVCDNISDNILETLMKTVLQDLKKLYINHEDYNAKSNLMWASTLSENKMVKYSKKLDCGIRQIAHQLSENIGCMYEEAVIALISYHYEYIYSKNSAKFLKLIKYIWDIKDEDIDNKVSIGIGRLSKYMKEIGLATSLEKISIKDLEQINKIAFTYQVFNGGCKKMTQIEVYNILKQCYEEERRK
jgi:alcohol dehydrogenase YqhD (iron-dependent ADH family)